MGSLVPSLVFLLLFSAGAWADPKFPPLTGQIVDEADLLNATARDTILSDLKSLEGKSSDQVAVYTAKSLQGYDIADFGFRLGRAWGIGQKDTNNGVILIVAPAERKIRIEVGRGLEGELTDLMSGLIIRNTILPAFKRGDFAGGIEAGVRDIRDTLLGDAEGVKQRSAKRPTAARQAPGGEAASTLLFIVVVLVLIFWLQSRQSGPPGAMRRSGGIAPPIFFPGGWGGGPGGGRDNEGGWSGGGGDFSGGGASGDW